MLICSVLLVMLAFERIEGLWAVFRSETSFAAALCVENSLVTQLLYNLIRSCRSLVLFLEWKSAGRVSLNALVLW